MLLRSSTAGGARINALILLCLVTLAVAAVLRKPVYAAGEPAGGETVGVGPDKITIGSCLPFSGKLQVRGELIYHAVSSYFNHINESGGINGRKVDYQHCDDVFDPEKAIICYNSCLKGKVFAQVFCIGSPSIIKYVRMSELHGMPLFGLLNGTTAAYELHPNVFMLRPSYAQEAEQQIKALWDVHHIRKIVLLYETDAFGSSVREAVIASMKERHAELLREVSFSRAGVDLDDALKTAKEAGGQAIIVVGHTGVMPLILKARKEQNWNQLCITVSSLDDALVNSGALADGMVITQVAPPLDEHLPSAALYVKLLHKYYPHVQPREGGFEAFLNAMVFVEGLKRCGPQVTRENFIKALESMHNVDIGAGNNFRVNFSTKNHQGWPSSSIYFDIIRNGKLSPMTEADWAKLIKQAG